MWCVTNSEQLIIVLTLIMSGVIIMTDFWFLDEPPYSGLERTTLHVLNYYYC